LSNLHSSAKIEPAPAHEPVGSHHKARAHPLSSRSVGRLAIQLGAVLHCGGPGPNWVRKTTFLDARSVLALAWPKRRGICGAREGFADLIKQRHGCGQGKASENAVTVRSISRLASRPGEESDVQAEGPWIHVRPQEWVSPKAPSARPGAPTAGSLQRRGVAWQPAAGAGQLPACRVEYRGQQRGDAGGCDASSLWGPF